MAQQQDQQEQMKLYGRIVARAWSDAAFKQRFLREPAAVLREFGLHVPEGMQVHVHEVTPTEAHVVLPARPGGLSDDQLAQVAGGEGDELFNRLPVKIAHFLGVYTPMSEEQLD